VQTGNRHSHQDTQRRMTFFTDEGLLPAPNKPSEQETIPPIAAVPVEGMKGFKRKRAVHSETEKSSHVMHGLEDGRNVGQIWRFQRE
jgi:hypothetical protein